MQEVRFAQSARKHKIGKAHALAALENAGDPVVVPPPSDKPDDLDDRLVFIGTDDRGWSWRSSPSSSRPSCS